MRKLEKRAVICLALAVVLLLGCIGFVVKIMLNGNEWATFYANDHIYSDRRLSVGAIYDRNGEKLAKNTKKGILYNNDEEIRIATLHAVGDKYGNISTSALSSFRDKIVGYNFLTGTYSVAGKGNEIDLTIDAKVCRTAYEALAGRDGLVGVYNYETGDIICMVSGPSFDPENPPEISDDDTSGVYLNKFLSAAMVPGSIFKLVTSAAAIETVDDIDDFSYCCEGVDYISDKPVRCTYAHGNVDFAGALASSCNCAFAQIANKTGAENMKNYTKQFGLTKSYDIDGIGCAKGSFKFPDDSDLSLGWAGIGQYEDLLNPCSMLVFLGAIANGGTAAEPRIIKNGISTTHFTDKMMKSSTAKKMRKMMKNNVVETYGEYNFPDLDIYAKSGTAEISGSEPNAWFCGFIKNDNAPYAFIVCVENGGYGSSVAGPVANQVLQELIK